MRLPPKVHAKHGAAYYVDKNKWTFLCRLNEGQSELFAALARIHKPAPPETVNDILDAYIREKLPEKRKTTQASYMRAIDGRLRHHFGHVGAKDLSLPEVAAYLEKRRKDGHGTSGNREVAVLSSAYDYALRQMWVEGNPCRGCRRNEENPKRTLPTIPEIAGAVRRTSPSFRLVLLFAFRTGLRWGDIRAMRRDQLTEAGIEVNESKRGRRILVRWSPKVRVIVRRAMARHDLDFVFTNERRQPWETWAMQSAMRRLQLPWTFHDLRAAAETYHETGLGLLSRYKRRREVDPVSKTRPRTPLKIVGK